MTALIVVAAVVAVVVLLGLIRCRAEAAYNENGFAWRVTVGPFTIAPRAGGREKHKPKKPERETHKTPDMAMLRAFFDLGLRLLKRFFKRLKIDLLRVHFTASFDDPYDTAMAYGYAGSAMEAFTAFAAGRIRRLDLHTQPDFDSAQPVIDVRVEMSVRLGSLVQIAISALFGFLSIRRRAEKKLEKENEHGKSVDR